MALVDIWRDGKIIQVDEAELSLDNLPSFVVPATRTYKADIWRRATDAEAEMIDMQINDQPLKLRNLFRDAQYLEHSDPFFSELKLGFVTAFGQDRAEELLAPS